MREVFKAKFKCIHIQEYRQVDVTQYIPLFFARVSRETSVLGDNGLANEKLCITHVDRQGFLGQLWRKTNLQMETEIR